MDTGQPPRRTAHKRTGKEYFVLQDAIIVLAIQLFVVQIDFCGHEERVALLPLSICRTML